MSTTTAPETNLTQLQELLKDNAEVRPAEPQDAVDGVVPALVVAPRTEAAARELVAWCGQHSVTLVVRGGGTKIGVGAPPSRCDVVIETRLLQEIFEHDEGNATVTVGAGITLAALNEAVAARGQFVPLEGPAGATLGGIVATNEFGPSRLKYGMPRDLVLGTYALLSDGRELRTGGKVVKNVSGYDLTKLLVGSHGSLGLITRVTLRLRPKDAAHAEWTGQFSSWTEAEEQAAGIFDGPFEPTSLHLSGTDTAVALHVTFDGVENAVEVQENRLPVSSNTVRSVDEIFDASWTLRAVLPVRSAGEWATAARGEGAQISWDFGSGRVVAAFQKEPDVIKLRRLAEKLNGSVVVLNAPSESKSLEIVWGKPTSAHGLATSLKEKLDPKAIFSPGRFLSDV